MMKKLLFLLLFLQFSLTSFSQNKAFDISKLERDVQTVIKKIYSTSVCINTYDSVGRKAGPGLFTGVVVDAEGYILSAAHAVRPTDVFTTVFTGGKEYSFFEVTFPDGRKFKAVGLGTIPSSDVAVLKIIEKGNWPYAEMGWSSSLKQDMPCISIAYPGPLGTKKPTVRLGYIAEVQTSNGFIRSTCLMEPGDSGGPLFDMQGRVIGLHSRVNLALDDNFEVPVDLYRKYWTALNKPVGYTELPAEQKFAADRKAETLKTVPELKNIGASLQKVQSQLKNTSMSITSRNRGLKQLILGTLVDLDGFVAAATLKGKSFLISKSSMVADQPIVELMPGKQIAAMVIARDENNDLVLLQIDQSLQGGVKLTSVTTNPAAFGDLGKFLISPQPNQASIISVLGNTAVDIANVPNPTVIGLGVTLLDGKVMIVQVQPNGPAASADIEIGDQLISFNSKPMVKAEDLSKELKLYQANDTVVVQFAKGKRVFSKRIVLKSGKAAEFAHVAFSFTDGRSSRYSGFNGVLVHDGRLKPAECGGPLFDINGRLYGINIARISRTSTLAIPIASLVKFVQESLLKML
jgi:serine protease Do